jgi:DNA repair protein RadC
LLAADVYKTETMAKSNLQLADRLRYSVPRFRLFLIHEDPVPSDLRSLRTPRDVEDIFEPLRYSPEEQFVSLHLNARHEIIGLQEVSHGSLSASLVHPREVYKAALVANSYAILVCHNHPSGSKVFPSREDIDTTSQLFQAGKLLGIQLVDHLIVGPNQPVYSLRENHPHIWANKQ